MQLRRDNAGWLRQWEATLPRGAPQAPASYGRMIRDLRRQARQGRLLPFAVTYRDTFVGQLTVSAIAWGSACWAQLGYWIDQAHAGRGIIPTSVALASDHCFTGLGLHRVEIAIRPENGASLRVVYKLGFRAEGLRPRYLHIDGDWRDHLVFALTAEEVPEGLLTRWRRTGLVPAFDD